MGSSILGVGQSALAAAQVGLATTGHNIANASTPGYSRQVVIQGAVAGEDSGYGFVGKGTEVTAVKRVYSEYLSNQLIAAQTTKGQLEGYFTQIQQINNVLADPTAGLSPVMQEFFKGVQDLAADPNGAAARQSLLSTAESLAARFQSLSGQLGEVRQGINAQINSSITTINVHAQTIAQLNDAIEKAQGGSEGRAPNDLLDQRDYAIAQLSREVKVNVVKQGETYNVFIGNGQPLVVNTKTYLLQPAVSTTDSTRTQVAYQSKNGTVVLAENAFAGGGNLGALFDFRSGMLDQVQNSLGRVATSLGTAFNAQHALGQDQTGAPGAKFFNVAAPLVAPSSANTGTGVVTASISNAQALTSSDYRLQFIPSDGVTAAAYKVTRLSDGKTTSFPPPSATIDGVDFSVSGSPTATDDFLIRPTSNGAFGFSLAIADKSMIAAAAPVRVAAAVGNAGSGSMSAPTVTSTAALPSAVVSYSAATGTFSGFPAGQAVTVTNNGSSVTYAAGVAVPYTPGSTLAFSGIKTVVTGVPADGDTFTFGPNTNGQGDSRNALALGALQTTNLLDGGTSNLQNAYSQMVNTVGNKTRELEATSQAAGRVYTQALQAQQSESGVNLDEEAANLLRYQQAYLAAGKVMQTASQLFDVLLELGR